MRTTIFLSILCLLFCSCEFMGEYIEDNLKLAAGNYAIEFMHNGTQYNYMTNVENISTLVDQDIDIANVTNFFDGDNLDLSIVMGLKFEPGTTHEEIKSFFNNSVPSFLDENSYDVGSVFFVPFFFKSDNGGILAKDGEEYVTTNFTKTSDFYIQDDKECFDFEIEFVVFANTGKIPCGIGTDQPSCFNLFTNGKMQSQICL